jgi:alkyldihydroxyacetonephosphate synthase
MEGPSNRLLRLEAILKNGEGEKIRNKEQWFKHNGWGFKDTEFVIDSDGIVRITGNRYQFSGQKMPKFKEWAETEAKLDTSHEVEPQTDIPVDAPIKN